MQNSMEDLVIAKVMWRIIPFLVLLYFAGFLDRISVGFAALQMNKDLGFSPYVYGLGAGIFFAGYCFFEVPSNLLLHRFGARRWIARIMITWSIIAGATALVRTPTSFYIMRFLLGVAEAGLFPGIVYYLTYWVPASHRAKLIAGFMTAIPISAAIGGPLSGAVFHLDGTFGIAGWQWIFIAETVPSLVLGVLTLFYLSDKPEDARWLSPAEQSWLKGVLHAENVRRQSEYGFSLLQSFFSTRVLFLCLCYFGVEVCLYGVLLWLPQVFKNLGFSTTGVSYAVAIPYAITAIVMVVWSRHSDRTKQRVWNIMAAAFVSFCGLVASAFLADYPFLSVIAITFGVAGSITVLPIFWTLPSAILTGAGAAGGIALINAVGNIGGFFGPYIMGIVKNSTHNFAYGLIACGVGVLVTGIIAVLLGNPTAVEGTAPVMPGLATPAGE